ncbi:MAG: hypothetical protein K6A30_08765 [Lachnospiraceae bacterium]|nr:hypothetical protein [Lachnospiraceae bacterium]
MRVTNSMITMHSQNNINGTKGLVDTYNDQMTSQKKIAKPSDDPVVAIRSLRLRDSLNEVGQYTDKNIPDASSWIEVTETALQTMSDNLNDCYKACVNGTTGTLTADDRNTLLKNLQALVDNIYDLGNADYAGRTVFTGYKTNKTLTFQEQDTKASYSISQNFAIGALETKNRYTNTLEVPSNWDELSVGYKLDDEMSAVATNRIRLAYSKTGDTLPTVTIGSTDLASYSVTLTDGTQKIVEYSAKSYDEVESEKFVVPENAVYYVKETGELIFGDAVAKQLRSVALTNSNFSISVDYDKTGFEAGEVRPEMYFTCTDKTNSEKEINYTREDQDISYTIAANQELKVNTQAGEDGILSTSIARDIKEIMDAITAAQNASDKVDKIEEYKKNSLYADDEHQEVLNQWLEAAEKEKTLLDDNLQSMLSSGITKFQNYKATVDLAITDVGSRDSRLELTKTRMTTQKSTIQTLIKDNEDRELSDILVDFKSSYNAYESSLQAASKINQMTLLDYL